MALFLQLSPSAAGIQRPCSFPGDKLNPETTGQKIKLSSREPAGEKQRRTMAAAASSDRAAVVKEFDDAKTGVKGLVDGGATSVPAIFRHASPRPTPGSPHLSIPTVDLSLPRPAAVDLVRSATRRWGFFQIVNHGVPSTAINAAVSAVRSFHELPAEARSKFYCRGGDGGVNYFSNVDLFNSKAASWRDTLQLAKPDPDRIPAVCRTELLEWNAHVSRVAAAVMGLLSEGLGLAPERLEGMSLLDVAVTVCHYYPWCPEPDVTMGIAAHTDPSVLTVLVQDQVGGLQVKGKDDDGAEAWADVKPLPGALVINVGDLLRIISNNEYKSAHHRVLANPHRDARVSIATFFNPGKRGETDFYGPLPELVTLEKPAIYRNFLIPEFMKTFFSKELSTKHLVDHFELASDGKDA